MFYARGDMKKEKKSAPTVNEMLRELGTRSRGMRVTHPLMHIVGGNDLTVSEAENIVAEVSQKLSIPKPVWSMDIEPNSREVWVTIRHRWR